ncbi:MAG: hypothetical protein K1X88_23840 [Nannocystaceae bacterium]|nr:hypothetical protein [Nannocystaceae bacterium]
MAQSSAPRPLARLALRRVQRGAVVGPTIVQEPWPPTEVPYSRTLWGAFMPERRQRAAAPPHGLERRRG